MVSGTSRSSEFWARRGMRLLGVAMIGVFSLVGGVVAVLTDGVALVVVPAVVLVLLAANYARTFVCIGIVAILMARTLEQVLPVPGIGALDEVIVAIAVTVLPLKRISSGVPLRTIPGSKWFAGFFVVGVLSTYFAAVPVGTALSGAVLAMKGISFGFAIAQINWRPYDLERVARYGFAGVVLLAGSGLVNFVSPPVWSRWVLNMAPPEARYGVTPVTGLFVHPGYFGTALSLGIIAIVCFRRVLRSRRGLGAISISAVAVLLTLRRKVLGGLLVGLLFVLSATAGFGVLGLSAIGAPIAAFVAGDVIGDVVETTSQEYLSDPESVARVRLTLDAPGVAFDYFPLGAGFGRFGSAAARAAYSPIYESLNYPEVWGLGPTSKNGKFLTDTFWPGVLGETGYIGTFCFLGGLVSIGLFLRDRLRRAPNTSYARWIYLTATAWMLALLLESVAGAIFSAVPTYALFFGVVGLAAGFTDTDVDRVPIESLSVPGRGGVGGHVST